MCRDNKKGTLRAGVDEQAPTHTSKTSGTSLSSKMNISDLAETVKNKYFGYVSRRTIAMIIVSWYFSFGAVPCHVSDEDGSWALSACTEQGKAPFLLL